MATSTLMTAPHKVSVMMARAIEVSSHDGDEDARGGEAQRLTDRTRRVRTSG